MDVNALKKSLSDKLLLPKPKKKIDDNKNKFLIDINIPGSAGPMRFVVNENDTVSEVVGAALKLYARQKGLPILGSDVNSFLLYPTNAGLNALDVSKSIGLQGERNFVLCRLPEMAKARSELIPCKKIGRWVKSWYKFNKSLSLKI